MTRTKRELDVDRREELIRRAIAQELRHQREDAGISLSRLARAAGITPGFLSKIEAGDALPTVHTYVAVCRALGGDLRMRFEPGAGVPLRDRYQAPMIEALLRMAHLRWKRFTEVPVHRPVRGVIDLVLHDPDAGDVIAAEAHSLIQRLEQQQRWANLKADALIGSSELPLILPGARRHVSRACSCSETHRSIDDSSSSSQPPFRRPIRPTADAIAALTGTTRWPGSALLWVRVRGSEATVRYPRRQQRA